MVRREGVMMQATDSVFDDDGSQDITGERKLEARP